MVLLSLNGMAVSVIDTLREFKLVSYTGDDETSWPQWVLKFEAWSELVGWGRHLDVVSQSTYPIANTTLDAEVQPDLKTTVRNRRSET